MIRKYLVYRIEDEKIPWLPVFIMLSKKSVKQKKIVGPKGVLIEVLDGGKEIAVKINGNTIKYTLIDEIPYNEAWKYTRGVEVVGN